MDFETFFDDLNVRNPTLYLPSTAKARNTLPGIGQTFHILNSRTTFVDQEDEEVFMRHKNTFQ